MKERRGKSTFWDRLSIAYSEKLGRTLSQEKAGNLIGSGQSAGRKWRHGGLPSMAHCIAIATGLGVTVEWLYTGRGAKYPLNKNQVAALRAFDAIRSRERQLIAIGWLEAQEESDHTSRSDDRPDMAPGHSDKPTH